MKTKILLSGVFALALSAFMAVGAAAADYDFEGAEPRQFYPSTSYESVYDAQYNYGGRNAVDYDIPELPYGVVSNTSIGAAERVRLTYDTASSTIGYGLSYSGGHELYTLSSTPSAAVQPIAYEQALFTSIDGMTLSDGSIGTVKIPSLNISMKVWEGETNASMAKGMAHYSATSAWNGNVGLCGHNRGAKYVIGSVKELSLGDTITYTTVYGTRTYAVSYVGVIANNDWSYLQAASDNRITITTCLADHPESRVAVQAVETILQP